MQIQTCLYLHRPLFVNAINSLASNPISNSFRQLTYHGLNNLQELEYYSLSVCMKGQNGGRPVQHLLPLIYFRISRSPC